MGDAVVGIPSKDQLALVEQTVSNCRDQEERIYMDYNATTPLEPEVIMAITEALKDAWGNPSSTYLPGRKAKGINDKSRESVASMVNGHPDDIIFLSGGTEANNLVFHTAVKHFWDSWGATLLNENQTTVLPHIITSSIEHDSVKITAESLLKEGKADITFVKVSKVTGRVEVNDVLAAVRPNTCLISVMLANNETGVIMVIALDNQPFSVAVDEGFLLLIHHIEEVSKNRMPIKELCQSVQSLNVHRSGPRILLHSDGAQAVGKVKVDVQELGVDYLTIVGHKFYGPRIGALYVNRPGSTTPLFPMFFGGGQERNFRPGTENTPMIAGLGKAAELVNLHLLEYEACLYDIKQYLEQRLKTVFGKEKIHFNSHFPGSETLPNTCNVSLLGPGLEGWKVLSNCRRLLASVGAACHSDKVQRPSHILLSCGIAPEVAANALRLSVGRKTTRKDVDLAVEDLKEAVCRLEGGS